MRQHPVTHPNIMPPVKTTTNKPRGAAYELVDRPMTAKAPRVFMKKVGK